MMPVQSLTGAFAGEGGTVSRQFSLSLSLGAGGAGFASKQPSPDINFDRLRDRLVAGVK